jgi:hypothetical protein
MEFLFRPFSVGYSIATAAIRAVASDIPNEGHPHANCGRYSRQKGSQLLNMASNILDLQGE